MHVFGIYNKQGRKKKSVQNAFFCACLKCGKEWLQCVHLVPTPEHVASQNSGTRCLLGAKELYMRCLCFGFPSKIHQMDNHYKVYYNVYYTDCV